MPEAPSADPFNAITHPYGRRAGDNLTKHILCSSCYKPPTLPPRGYTNARGKLRPGGYFLFRTEASAREYFYSGLCQSCQDRTFSADVPDQPTTRLHIRAC